MHRLLLVLATTAALLVGTGFAQQQVRITGVQIDELVELPAEMRLGVFLDLGDGARELGSVRLVAGTSDYDAPAVGVAMLVEARRLAGDHWTWNVAHMDRLAGTDALRKGIDAGQDAATLVASWPAQIEAFKALRAPYLIY